MNTESETPLNNEVDESETQKRNSCCRRNLQKKTKHSEPMLKEICADQIYLAVTRPRRMPISDFEILKRLDAGAVDNLSCAVVTESFVKNGFLIHTGQIKNIDQKSKPPLLSAGLRQKVRFLRSARHLQVNDIQ